MTFVPTTPAPIATWVHALDSEPCAAGPERHDDALCSEHGRQVVPALLPAIGHRVTVTFPGSAGYDTETVTGVVTDHDADSCQINTGPGLGEGFTLHAAELDRVTVEDLGSDADLEPKS